MKWIGQITYDETSYFREDILIEDGNKLKLGDGGDGEIYVSGDDLYIVNTTDDKDIIFQSDDQSGGVETYFFLDGSTGHTTFPDNKKLSFGADRDFRLYHDGSSSLIQGLTGDLVIINYADDKDIILQSDDGSGGTTTYLSLSGSASRINVEKFMRFADNVGAYFGYSYDLRLYHDGIIVI
jgi:hypothetical protein